MYLEHAETPERALEMIRGMLDLPGTADVEAVMVELEKVKAWDVTDTAPPGVDTEELIAGLRTILNLRALSTTEEVFAEVDRLKENLAPSPEAIAAALPKFRPGAPNNAIALERATLSMVTGARTLTREVLYEKHVHPALMALKAEGPTATGKLTALSYSPAPIKAGAEAPKDQPVLDVRALSGRNPTERLLTHVKLTSPHLSHDAAFRHALELKKTHRVLA